MKKKFSPKITPQSLTAKTGQDYSYKPAKMGAVVKRIMEEKNISKKDVADFMNVTVRTVEFWFKRAHFSILQTLKLSEPLDENLMLYYHPNVKPLPDPRDEEIKKLRGYDAMNKEREKLYEITAQENKSLLDQIELLKALLLEKNGK